MKIYVATSTEVLRDYRVSKHTLMLPIHDAKNAGIKVETWKKSQRLCSTVVFLRKKERVYVVLQRQSLRLFQRFWRRVSAALVTKKKSKLYYILAIYSV